jgi:hypothetical protein
VCVCVEIDFGLNFCVYLVLPYLKNSRAHFLCDFSRNPLQKGTNNVWLNFQLSL